MAAVRGTAATPTERPAAGNCPGPAVLASEPPAPCLSGSASPTRRAPSRQRPGQTSDDDSSVTWSPDGRWLATFSAEAIHVVSLDGAESYCITNEGGYGALEWLP